MLLNDFNNRNTNSNNFDNNGSDNANNNNINTEKILITSSYLIIANVNKVLISFKNMVNLCHMIFNSFNNIT